MAFMIEVEVGEYEKREIDEQIARILRDLGNPLLRCNFSEIAEAKTCTIPPNKMAATPYGRKMQESF
jgi:hypothetical protein